jgi:hypothetical protein
MTVDVVAGLLVNLKGNKIVAEGDSSESIVITGFQ